MPTHASIRKLRARHWLEVSALASTLFAAVPTQGAAPHVEFWRTPDGGIQPQSAVGSDGTVHLVFLKGPPGGGDVFYCRRTPGAGRFSPAIRVNRHPGSAIAIGSIRGAQIALGKNGRVHLIWNGTAPAKNSRHMGAPLWYTRSDQIHGGFEEERDMISDTRGLDGGSGVAADARGHVYVAWHALPPGAAPGEGNRAVFLRRSEDDGAHFSAEAVISPPWGVCGCCGMRMLADRSGQVAVLYRAARDSIYRAEVLLASEDFGSSFRAAHEDLWKTPACPMSSAWLEEDPRGTLAAWETAGQIRFGRVPLGATPAMAISSAPGPAGGRKHPVIVSNGKGIVLLAWTEGTGWERGGEIAWQLFDENGAPESGRSGHRAGVPVWGTLSAFAEPDGDFVVLY